MDKFIDSAKHPIIKPRSQAHNKWGNRNSNRKCTVRILGLNPTQRITGNQEMLQVGEGVLSREGMPIGFIIPNGQRCESIYK